MSSSRSSKGSIINSGSCGRSSSFSSKNSSSHSMNGSSCGRTSGFSSSSGMKQ